MKKNVLTFTQRMENWNVTEEQIDSLSPTELKYLKMMLPQHGVLHLYAPPGEAKTAMLKSITTKLNFGYVDIRISMVDETDMGLYPSVAEMTQEDGSTIRVLDYVVPKWAVKSNERPTIVVFEELNRGSLPTRNAALQILLERTIGSEFKFTDKVLMAATGNLGEEDGTDVEEYDTALKNRLIHVEHILTPDEWLKYYAIENVHPLVVRYITAEKDALRAKKVGDTKTSVQNKGFVSPAFATPRSWTILSDYLISTFGVEDNEKTMSEINDCLLEIGDSYIGVAAIAFSSWIQDELKINIQHIIDNYSKIKDDVAKYQRDKRSQLTMALRDRNVNEMTTKQIANVIGFLESLQKDECVGYLMNLVDNMGDNIDAKPTDNENMIMSKFKPLLDYSFNMMKEATEKK